MKTIEINGETFEVINPDTKQGRNIIWCCNNNWLKDWNELYKRPSYEKTRIRDYWASFLNEVGALFTGYRGNSMTFSIYSKTEDKYFYITRAHNYVVCAE